MSDLDRLAQIAKDDLQDLFARNSQLNKLANKVICIVLCQGAALHYIDGQAGVKDFDIFTFFEGGYSVSFPPRRRKVEDFGDDKFGQTLDHPHFVGRRVDLMGRSIVCQKDADLADVVRHYLIEQKTATAVELSKKGVIILEPASRRGEVIWPSPS
jgi:hypothetical protein